MKTCDANINFRIPETDRERFRRCILTLRDKLGSGATMSNVILLMIRAMIRAVESGKEIVWPPECLTLENRSRIVQYPNQFVDAVARVAEKGGSYSTSKGGRKPARRGKVSFTGGGKK
jgi:hypothetical protein